MITFLFWAIVAIVCAVLLSYWVMPPECDAGDYLPCWGVVHEDGHTDLFPGCNYSDVERFAEDAAKVGRYGIKWFATEADMEDEG